MKLKHLLIAIVFLLCACDSQFRTNFTATPDQNFAQPTAFIEANPKPVAIVYLERTKVDAKIVPYSLNAEIIYPELSVNARTQLRSQAVIDSEQNIYIVHGTKYNFFSKFEPNGEVRTVELPNEWTFSSVWLRDKLLILPSSVGNYMLLVDTELDIDILPYTINTLPDGSREGGTLGIANSPNPTAIWVSDYPIQTEHGTYAYYRTFNIDTFEMNSELLKISETKLEEDSSVNDDNSLSLYIEAIDTETKNVLLCKSVSAEKTENKYGSVQELYSTSEGLTLSREDKCCFYNYLDIRGGTYIENYLPKCCPSRVVRNLSDNQPTFDIEQYTIGDDPNSVWLRSNGKYWIIMTDKHATVINEAKQFEAVYSLPSMLPKGILPGSEIEVAFLIEN